MSKRNRNTPNPNGRRAQRLAARRAAQQQAAVVRPFAGLAAECDLVALREFVPSATAKLALAADVPGADRPVLVATVLPGAVAALVRAGDEPTGFVAMQVQYPQTDAASDLAAAIVWARTSSPGSSLTTVADWRAENPTPTSETASEDDRASIPVLASVVDAKAALDINVYRDFSWWVPPGVTPDPQVAAAIQQANRAIRPSARMDLGPDAIGAPWWVDAGERAHMRWVRPEDEDALMLALARVHAAGALHLGPGSRFAGSFRTQGLLVPVFDLDRAQSPEHWVSAASEFDARLTQALATDAPLSDDQRRSRDGLRARQVTLR